MACGRRDSKIIYRLTDSKVPSVPINACDTSVPEDVRMPNTSLNGILTLPHAKLAKKRNAIATIVKAVQWGRGIYDNFQRFIQFQLTVNFASVIVVLLLTLTGLKAPFTAIQLLWINIIMDGPPAIALGLEPIRGDLMNRKPTKRNANIVTKKMFGKIIYSGIIMIILFMIQSKLNIK